EGSAGVSLPAARLLERMSASRTATTLLDVNAFRVLGLDGATTLDAIRQRANELQAYLGIGASKTYPGDFPTFVPPPRTLETVAAALQRLDTPEARLTDSVLWFTIQDPIDTAAAASLTEGRAEQARRLWTEAARAIGTGRGRWRYL